MFAVSSDMNFRRLREKRWRDIRLTYMKEEK